MMNDDKMLKFTMFAVDRQGSKVCLRKHLRQACNYFDMEE